MTVRFEETFTVRRPPEDVFAFMVEPCNVAKWQTVKTYGDPAYRGFAGARLPPAYGTKVRPRERDAVVEFEPGRAFGVRVA